MTRTEAARQAHGCHDERNRERGVGEKDRWEEEEMEKKNIRRQ